MSTVHIDYLPELVAFRKSLHQFPELSGREHKTSEAIKTFLAPFQPTAIIDGLAKTGMAVIFEGNQPGKTIMIRCDIDALLIDEKTDVPYKSLYKGVSHSCGHDGHTAIAAGLAPLLYKNKIEKGRMVLLFQPSEEIGYGADTIIKDPKFKDIEPDYIFTLHNLPGFEEGQIVVSENIFAAASKGMIINLIGKTAHAAYPENGVPPTFAMARIIDDFSNLENEKYLFADFILATIIYARLGEVRFGTSPGSAEVMATMRAYQDDDMEALTNLLEKIVHKHARAHQLNYKIRYAEEFPMTLNNAKAGKVVMDVAKELKCDMHVLTEPFRWSEDFGHFTNHYKGAIFGLGAGLKHAQLHNSDYDFPDQIIGRGIKMLYGIIQKVLETA